MTTKNSTVNATATPPINLADDDFTLFGLPHTFALNAQALGQTWRELQSRVHPDRYVGESAQQQRLAMQWSVRVNEAYRRLQDPVRRGAYLCELRGATIDAERNTAMPPAFLLRQLGWRESMDEATDDAALATIDGDVLAFQHALLTQLADALDVKHDAAQAALHVRALMFVGKLRADVAKRRDGMGS